MIQCKDYIPNQIKTYIKLKNPKFSILWVCLTVKNYVLNDELMQIRRNGAIITQVRVLSVNQELLN
jgi:hypothetical protein